MSRSLIVLPDDSAQPILDAIAQATKSIRIKMFVFSDPALLQAVIAAHQRGVDVRVMLNPARRDGKEENADSRKLLTDAGIKVIDSNPDFDLTHEKSMVIDDAIAFVQSLNWETENLTTTRDYAIAHHAQTRGRRDRRSASTPTGTAPNSTPAITPISSGASATAASASANLSTSAKHSLWLQNERYQDPVIIEHLIRAQQPRRQDPHHGPPAA